MKAAATKGFLHPTLNVFIVLYPDLFSTCHIQLSAFEREMFCQVFPLY